MKKFLVFILFGCFTLLLADKLEEIKKRGVITIGVKQDFKPFGFLDEKNQTVGFDIDIAKYIAKKMKVEVELKKVLSKERIPKLVDNSVDIVIASMTINEERAKIIDFSKPYFFETQAMLVRQDASEKSYKDFDDKLVGAIQGATSGVNLSKLAPKIKVVYFQEYPQVLNGLKTGLIKAVTTDYSWCFAQADDNKDSFKVLGDAISYEPYGIGIVKNEKALLDTINKIVRECVKDGTYSKIYQKWFKKKPLKLP